MLCLVQTYSGRVDEATGRMKMRFEVRGTARSCEALCRDISEADFVHSWRLGCPVLHRKIADALETDAAAPPVTTLATA